MQTWRLDFLPTERLDALVEPHVEPPVELLDMPSAAVAGADVGAAA